MTEETDPGQMFSDYLAAALTRPTTPEPDATATPAEQFATFLHHDLTN